MNVDVSNHATSGPVGCGPGQLEDVRFKAACKDVEGIFLAMVMKAGLKTMIEGEDDDNSHASGLMEATVEQVANQMAESESLGIAAMLYEQVAGAAKKPERTTP